MCTRKPEEIRCRNFHLFAEPNRAFVSRCLFEADASRNARFIDYQCKNQNDFCLYGGRGAATCPRPNTWCANWLPGDMRCAFWANPSASELFASVGLNLYRFGVLHTAR